MAIFVASVSQEVVDTFVGKVKESGAGLNDQQMEKVVQAFIDALVACANGIDIHHPDKVAGKTAKNT